MGLITVATIISVSLNAFNNGYGFAYNSEFAEDIVTTTVVYKKSDNGKYLSHHLKYNYTYDEQQRVAQKEVLRWNACAEKWEKSHCLTYAYSDAGYSIEYVLWNKLKSDYVNVVAKQTYEEKTKGLIGVASYNWDQTHNDWVMKDNVVMMNPGEQLLSSQELKLEEAN